MKNSIDSYGALEKYIDDNTRQEFMKRLLETVDWIYGDGTTAPLSAYKERLNDFKATGNPIKQRYRFRSEIEVYFE
jgi:hypothetical protein